MRLYPLFITALAWAVSVVVYAQQPSFALPINPPIYFSGNFGEIRANHFHGGLDFKTGGAIGKPVYALGDGYVSKIRVTHGSGYVLEIAYDNGYTTINRHLSAFTDEIAERVEELQYEQQSWEVEIIPEPGEYVVKAGQKIALSGNTGYSFGPHLHLDVIETDTGDSVDPLPFFKNKIIDHTAPRAMGIRLYPQPGEGVAEGMTAWGVIGVGLRAYDYMDEVHNRYGVYRVSLSVDGKETFRSIVDRFAPAESRMINAWADGQYMKSFIEPGCTLRMLQALNDRRGLLTIDEERPYHLVYTLSDALGNTSKVTYVIQGKRMPIVPMPQADKYIFRWERTNLLQEPGMSLVVPRGNLYSDAYLNYAVRADSTELSYVYQLHDRHIPLHGRATLRIRLRRTLHTDSTKYYVASINAKGERSGVKGSYADGYLTATIRELGTYVAAIDTVPPKVTPLNPARWIRNGRIIYKVEDKHTGIQSYRGTIDGKYALFGIPNSINERLEYRIDRKRIGKGRHTIEVTVTDMCGNVTVRTDTIML
ncbi:MAG: M23 family metallopeptidase [Mediterranea sp.]|jgi:hypothetical protein|nr:M23 family metallopeptidase [Mediterranea sp.]